MDQITAWHDVEFSNLPISKQYEWAIGGDFNVLLNVEDHFAGFVGLMKREAAFDGERKWIAGVRGLVVDRQWRHKGLGQVLMREAHKVIFRTLKANYGFLLCPRELEPFYSSLAWQPIPCRVYVESKNLRVPWTETAMILSDEGDATIESFQEIDLMGKAF